MIINKANTQWSLQEEYNKQDCDANQCVTTFEKVLLYKIKGFYLVGEKRSTTYSRLRPLFVFILHLFLLRSLFLALFLTSRHITGLRSILWEWTLTLKQSSWLHWSPEQYRPDTQTFGSRWSLLFQVCWNSCRAWTFSCCR
jgi:hypothetical protein